jgi:hypothetical protein
MNMLGVPKYTVNNGSPSCQYKSRLAKNVVNRGTKKTPAPPSPVTKK